MIQKEMLRNGPVVTEFHCDDNFGIYSSGVMIQGEKPKSSLAEEAEEDLIEYA